LPSRAARRHLPPMNGKTKTDRSKGELPKVLDGSDFDET
jgi:hypothetical protein